MTCEGCANAAKKVLSKLGEDVIKVDADISSRKLTVTTNLQSDVILNALKKTGKNCSLVS
uniref:Copper transport protein ATOX1 n=1 Tax=Syphacia muris TaxID=451379 RepID=A0A0N5AMS6_9BILA